MRFLFIKDSPYIPEWHGECEVATHGLCGILKRAAQMVAVASVTKPNPLWTDMFIQKRLGYPVFSAENFQDAVRKAICNFKPELVVYHEPSKDNFRQIWDIISDFPTIFYHHSLPSNLVKFYRSDAIQDFILDGTLTAVLSNSITCRDFLLKAGVHSTIIPPLFGIECYKGRKRKGDCVLMFSAQYHKGVDITLGIAERRHDIVFKIIDDWREEFEDEVIEYRNMIASLPNVRLIKQPRSQSKLYKSSSLLLMPSRCSDGWGRVATEAQLFGIPVLGSNKGNLPDTIGPGGVVLDPDAGLTVWLKMFDKILSDSEYYTALSTAARKHGESYLRQVDATADLFVHIAQLAKSAFEQRRMLDYKRV